LLAGGITQGAFARDTRDESRAHHLLGLGEWFKIAIHEELFLLATRVGYAAVAAADARAVEAAPLAAGVPVCAARVQTVT